MALFFEDLEPGLRIETPARTITEADVANFAGVSGDFNPLHTDEEFARGTTFGRRVAHGLLALAVATGLRQRTGAFEGSLLAFLEIRSWRFLGPVFPGDTIRAVNEIVERRPTSKPDRGVVVQRVRVVNQRGEVVQEGEFVSLIRRREDAGSP
ncbi:MAG: MaoC family dehydratase N-terminal domain-containing protein [Thermomicrobiaceae bacterium]|nr:MaoC family dehydratase N-terminal domain-containing protein [Thermomicrobiaceae bacterium]